MAVSLLFTGHMIDLPGRAEPRFPASLENAARRRIARAIEPYAPAPGESLGAGMSDILGFASGARGGDLLFHEECRRRRIDTVVAVPFEPEVFVETSVDIPGTDWRSRFWNLWNATPADRRHVLGLPRTEKAAYAVCNMRLLEIARQNGRVHLIALWDGKEGGGPGGTADLVSKIGNVDRPDIFSPQDIQA